MHGAVYFLECGSMSAMRERLKERNLARFANGWMDEGRYRLLVFSLGGFRGSYLSISSSRHTHTHSFWKKRSKNIIQIQNSKNSKNPATKPISTISNHHTIPYQTIPSKFGTLSKNPTDHSFGSVYAVLPLLLATCLPGSL